MISRVQSLISDLVIIKVMNIFTIHLRLNSGNDDLYKCFIKYELP